MSVLARVEHGRDVSALKQDAPSRMELIPAAAKQKLREIDAALGAYHECCRDSDYAMSALLLEAAQARAEQILKDALLDSDVLTIFRALAGRKRGFAVATKGNPMGASDLRDDELIDLMIDAAMKGLRFRGNEFTIIAKGIYANKEAYRRFLRELGAQFTPHIGVAVPHETDKKKVVVEAAIAYQWRCQSGTLEFRNINEFDQRIVLKSYETDSEDLWRGKVESKLYRRLFAHLTGYDLPCYADADDGVIDGQVVPPVAAIVDNCSQPAQTQQAHSVAASEDQPPSAAEVYRNDLRECATDDECRLLYRVIQDDTKLTDAERKDLLDDCRVKGERLKTRKKS